MLANGFRSHYQVTDSTEQTCIQTCLDLTLWNFISDLLGLEE